MAPTFQSSNPQFTNTFVGHVLNFVKKYSLFSLDSDLLITVSGGVDSIVLCHVMHRFKKYGYSGKVRVLHIHHNSRGEQDLEQKLVEDFAISLGFEFSSIKLHQLEKNNFEHEARLKRYQHFYTYAKPAEQILLGHHIDDSFEWTLMQNLRSSNLKGSLGIPLVNGKVKRPFMCVSKKQILNYARCFKLPYRDDPTNEDIKFERNYLRNLVIPLLATRYKKYLKHYVFRQNELASQLGVHYGKNFVGSYQITLSDNSVLLYSIQDKLDISDLKPLLLKGLKHLNPNSRGSNAKQFEKVGLGLKNYKHGPLSLTSGIKAYLDYNTVLLTKESAPRLNETLGYDRIGLAEFKGKLQELMSNSDLSLSFPFYVIVFSAGVDKANFTTTFNRAAVKSLKDDNISFYPALRLLREWSKKRNAKKFLRIKFLINH